MPYGRMQLRAGAQHLEGLTEVAALDQQADQRTALPSATSNPSRSARHRCRGAAKIKARTLI